ncbi:MAG TPA: radical SAM protein [Planctomycetota bacterium]|nr:radical SAM protein [Planctomycetota bacterium]
MSHYCPAVDGFYLRASGEIACWTSPGEDDPMFRIDPKDAHKIDYVADILNGDEFRRMRRELWNHRDPYAYCESCGWGCPQMSDQWWRVDKRSFELKTIRTLQVEPSFLCNLDCLQCMPFHSRTLGKGNKQIDRRMYEKALDDLVAHGIGVENTYYAGFGEPLMNPEFPELARYAREKIGGIIVCDTNANFRFRPEFLDCGLDWLVMAVDGNNQKDYETYRRRGDHAKVMRFVEDACNERHRRADGRTKVVWKTVMFQWNSSDEDLRTIVRRANDLGVDEIRLVNTITPGGISANYATSRWSEIRALAAELSASSRVPLTLIHPECFTGDPTRCHGFVEAVEEVGDELSVKGWVLLDDGPPDEIRVHTSDGRSMPAKLFARPDLEAAHPTIPNAKGGGFEVRAPAAMFCPDRAVYALDLTLLRGTTERAAFQVRYLSGLERSERGPIKLRNQISIEVP